MSIATGCWETQPGELREKDGGWKAVADAAGAADGTHCGYSAVFSVVQESLFQISQSPYSPVARSIRLRAVLRASSRSEYIFQWLKYADKTRGFKGKWSCIRRRSYCRMDESAGRMQAVRPGLLELRELHESGREPEDSLKTPEDIYVPCWCSYGSTRERAAITGSRVCAPSVHRDLNNLRVSSRGLSYELAHWLGNTRGRMLCAELKRRSKEREFHTQLFSIFPGRSADAAVVLQLFSSPPGLREGGGAVELRGWRWATPSFQGGCFRTRDDEIKAAEGGTERAGVEAGGVESERPNIAEPSMVEKGSSAKVGKWEWMELRALKWDKGPRAGCKRDSELLRTNAFVVWSFSVAVPNAVSKSLDTCPENSPGPYIPSEAFSHESQRPYLATRVRLQFRIIQ
ncbi:hypothetical protein DFH06DRAFT_1138631 [Mycena polygramma]|nr:hypothetical protein DFH06DRAFT_1138631 [Mycena polygramma]